MNISSNILLDYVLIGVFQMQAIGAALATVFAQTCSVMFACIVIARKDMGIHLSVRHLVPEKKLVGSMLQIGFPVALQDGLVPFRKRHPSLLIWLCSIHT